MSALQKFPLPAGIPYSNAQLSPQQATIRQLKQLPPTCGGKFTKTETIFDKSTLFSYSYAILITCNRNAIIGLIGLASCTKGDGEIWLLPSWKHLAL